MPRREPVARPEALTNGKWSGLSSHAPQHLNFDTPSPKSPDSDYDEEEYKTDMLDRRCVVLVSFKPVLMPSI